MENIINYIRGILRREGITGMDSVKHFIIFIVFKMMTPKLCKSIGMNELMSFETVIHDESGKKDLGAQELYDKFFFKGNEQLNFVGEFVNTFKFTNFKFTMDGIHNLKNIVNKLKELDIDNLATKYDIIGTIYELHLKSGTSKGAMRDLGQYYTHRLVIKYMIELCKPKVKNGIIEKIVDPTMGTGGFLTMSIRYLNEKYKGSKAIDWKKNKDNIIGFDIDGNVKNMALLNVFLELKYLCKNTIVKQDTLRCDLKFPKTCEILEKADVILANEPMGLKNIIHAECCERIREMKIRGTKAEPLFIQLFMEALDDGGRCAVIVPDGVLFNESAQHQGTRKHLVENFNLKKVTSLKDDDFFLNTGVKTSILFFEKDGGKTKEVDFCEITIVDDDIDETSIVKVPYEDIKNNKYSLFVNKYNIEEVEKIGGIEYKKLGDVCDFLKKSKRSASYGSDRGLFSFYTSSSKLKLCDEADYNEKSIIIGTGGNANIKYSEKFSCSADNFILKSDKCNIKYVYYYFQCNIKFLENGFSGSTIKHISKEYVKDLEIPIPSLKVQNAIVERLDLISENNKTLKLNIEQTKKITEYYLDSKLHCIKKLKLSTLCKINPSNLNLSDNYKFINYIDIGSVNNGVIGKYDKITEEYPSRAKRKIVKGDSIISTVRPNLKNYAYIHEDIENGIVSTGFCVIRSVGCNILNKFVYYMISTDQTTEYLTRNATGSSYPAVNSSIVSDIEIPIPSLQVQKEIVEYCDNLTDMIQKQEKQIDLNKNLMKQIMDNYLNSGKEQEKLSDDIDEDDFLSDEDLDDLSDSDLLDDEELEGSTKFEEEQEPSIEPSIEGSSEGSYPEPSPLPNSEEVSSSKDGEKMDKNELINMKVSELRNLCKEKGLGPYSKLKKDDLVKLLLE